MSNYGFESIDDEGNVTHFPTMADAVAAGYDRRNIMACVDGERDRHKGRVWRAASEFSAMPGFCAAHLTTRRAELPKDVPIDRLIVNECQLGYAYRCYLWRAGIVFNASEDAIRAAVRSVVGRGRLYWRSSAGRDHDPQCKIWLPPPETPLTKLPVRLWRQDLV